MAAIVAAASIHPSTRVADASRRKPASVAPSSATASTSERGVNRSRSVGDVLGIRSQPDMRERSQWTCGRRGGGRSGGGGGGRRDDPPSPCKSEAVPESGPPILGDDERPVRVVDLDWQSTLVVLGAFVGLIALTGAIRAAPH